MALLAKGMLKDLEWFEITECQDSSGHWKSCSSFNASTVTV